jgi:TRAP-type C4-dicarboxylate transport system permease large subunit
MVEVAVVLVVTFTVLLMLDVPIAIAIILSGFLAIVAEGSSDPGVVLALKLANGVNSFALLAIPFFILSGNLMGRGGLARRLIDFTSVLVGSVPGGLSYVNTLTCMLFGSISGSSAAAVSSVGGFMIPEMNRKGYDRDFNVAVTTTAATTGLMIPPSNVMIVYSVAAGSVSIAAMFMAGFIPGILTGLCIMLAAAVVSLRKGFRGEDIQIPSWKRWTATGVIVACIIAVLLAKSSASMLSARLFNGSLAIGIPIQDWHVLALAIVATCLFCFETFRRAFLTLLMIVIVIGGILAGIFTATEAAAISVVYAFLLSFVLYRQIKISELPAILRDTCITSAVVMLLIAACAGLSWIMTLANIPQTVSAGLLGLSDNPIVILIAINILLICVGTFMDMTPAILIFTPIFLPVVQELGMHPIHFGMMLIANLSIGLCTPPVGTCLFIGCKVGDTTIANVVRPLLPFYVAMAVSLMIITYVPSTSLWLPIQTDQLDQREVEQLEFLKASSGE